ncbi:MAG: ABC transporter permease [Clostridia bacterium]|nr:ABC transporter permease [Clostridia bacterium]
MLKYILKRLVYMVLVWVILSFLMFMIYWSVPTGNREFQEAKMEVESNDAYRRLPAQEKRALIEELTLEKQYANGTETNNLFVRYLRWLGFYPYHDGQPRGMLQGNFGYSQIYKKDVMEVVKAPMGNTVFINIFATLLALGITIPLGIATAVHRGSRGDKTMQVLTIIGYSLPTFIIAILFIWIFCWNAKWFPASGFGTPGNDFTGLKAFGDKMYYLALPLIVMTFCSLGGMTRYVRASMIEALGMDCIRTARAKGLKERTVIYSHAWRNALIPVITLVVGWFLGIFSGSVMIEQIFGLNGMGNLLITALNAFDFEVVLFLQMFYVTLSLLGNLIIDLAYGLADPRVRVNK